MTERENFLRMLERHEPHHLPLDVWVTEPALDMIEAHRGTRDHYSALGLSVENVGPRYPSDPDEWRAAYAELGVELSEDAEIGFAGLVHDVPPLESLGAAYHMREMVHPLRTVESVKQLVELPFPNVDDPRWYADIPAQVQRVQGAGRAAIGQMHCTIFELSWYLRGMEALYMDLIDGTGVADWLLDWFTHRACVAIRHYCAAGVDVVFLGDDVGTQRGMMMAIPFWREHLKPRLAKVIAEVRRHETKHTWLAYHSDGDVTPIVEELIEIGVELLNPVQPECMDVFELASRFSGRLGYWGMIGTQTTMPFGTPDDVRQTVRNLRRLAMLGEQVVLAPTHVIEPDVPWENLKVLADEAKVPIF